MKKLIAIALVLLVFTSCEKENYNDQFIAYWRANSSTIVFSEGVTTAAGMDRVFTNEGIVYISNFGYDYHTKLVKVNDQTILSPFTFAYKAVGNYSYQMGKFTPSTGGSCRNVGYKFYNISAKIVGDTLFETGNYDIYLDGQMERSINTFTAKYTKL